MTYSGILIFRWCKVAYYFELVHGVLRLVTQQNFAFKFQFQKIHAEYQQNSSRRVKFYSAFIQLECSDRKQEGLGQSLSPVSSQPRFKWMEVIAKPPQLGNRLGFFQAPTVSSSSTLDEIVDLFPFFCQRCDYFSCYILAKEWPG